MTQRNPQPAPRSPAAPPAPWSRSLAVAAGMALLWLAFSGRSEGLLLGLGVVSVLFVMLLARRLAAGPAHLGRLRRHRLPGYCLWLAWEICKSNLRIAALLLRPRLRVSPRVLRLEHGRRTDLGRAIHANSITLTPGTLTLRIDEHTLEVHALTEQHAAELTAGTLERRIAALEQG